MSAGCLHCGSAYHNSDVCPMRPHEMTIGRAESTVFWPPAATQPLQPTLRQRYAMAALTGLCAAISNDVDRRYLNDQKNPRAKIAEVAFSLADAMLAAEQKS